MSKRKSQLRHLFCSEYNALKNAIHRCHNERNVGYRSYGARGITVFDAWRSEQGFALFLDCIGPRPTRQHSLDRRNNNGNYEPKNVWWAPDSATQQRNRRKPTERCVDLGWGIGMTKATGTGRGKGRRYSPLVPYDGRTQTLSEWAVELELNPATIRQRLHRGLTPEQAFNPSTSRQGMVRQTGPAPTQLAAISTPISQGIAILDKAVGEIQARLPDAD